MQAALLRQIQHSRTLMEMKEIFIRRIAQAHSQAKIKLQLDRTLLELKDKAIRAWEDAVNTCKARNVALSSNLTDSQKLRSELTNKLKSANADFEVTLSDLRGQIVAEKQMCADVRALYASEMDAHRMLKVKVLFSRTFLEMKDHHNAEMETQVSELEMNIRDFAFSFKEKDKESAHWQEKHVAVNDLLKKSNERIFRLEEILVEGTKQLETERALSSELETKSRDFAFSLKEKDRESAQWQ